MKTQLINYILFIILLLLGLIQAISGFLLWLVIPGGHRGFGIGQITGDFIWSRFTWIEIHDWTAVALVIVVLVHIIIHWKWIIRMTKRMVGAQNNVEVNSGKEENN